MLLRGDNRFLSNIIFIVLEGSDDMTPYAKSIRISNKIYGREEELSLLKDAFKWASLGSTELVLISGQSGVGKSALVLEAFKPTVIGECYFASGKFDQYSKSVPYESIIRCFQHVIKLLLTEPEDVLQKWTKRVKQAVGSNGSVITEVIPEAKLLLGELPVSERLPVTESKHRFEAVFRRFVQAFTGADRPLVLFFDDVQWADEASLRMLNALITDPESQNLFVAAAYREQDWNENGNLFDQWLLGEHAGYSIRRLSLQPLEFSHILKMVSDFLECESEQCFPLAHALYVKSIGNPFYLKQLLKTANDEQSFRYNSAAGAWEWDMEALEQFPEIDGQLDFLISRINKVSLQTRQFIVIGACLGGMFQARTLSAVSGCAEDLLIAHLSSAVQEGLLMMSENSPSFIEYRFTHDRIQQAAYSLLDNRSRMEIHLAAGHFLFQDNLPEHREQLLFDMVNHFNQAIELLSGDELEMTVKLNEQAGRKAMQSAAYAKALEFFNKGIECLPADYWTRYFDFTFQLHLKRSECEYLCANYEKAESQLNDLLQRTQTWTERAQVIKLKIDQYSNTGQYAQAIALGLGALGEVGIRISERPHKLFILKETLLTKSLLDKRMNELPHLSEISDRQAIVMLELLVSLFASTFFSNREVFAVIVSKTIRFIFKHGSSPVAPVLYASFGMVLGTMLGQYAMGYKLGKIAVDMADQTNIAFVKTKVNVMFYGVISPVFA